MSNLRNLAILMVFFVPFMASAQFVPDPVQFITAPEVPGPNEQVTIKAEGVGSFLGDATITWRENGTVRLTGVGERAYTFTAGALGSETRITVSIQSQIQGLIERSFIFRPSIVNIIWEADTTAPLFYRGKPLYGAGSRLKVIAYPSVYINRSLVSSQSLSFQWSRNDEPTPEQSGMGRNTFSFAGDQLQNGENVKVDVYFGTNRVAVGNVFIPAQKPMVLLYNRDPLRGEILDTAFPSAISLTGQEITIQAEPYFFARESIGAGFVGFSWTMNNDEITGPESAFGLLTLRQTGEGTGGATLGVSVQNNDDDKLVQAAEVVMQIIFGGSTGTSLFGL